MKRLSLIVLGVTLALAMLATSIPVFASGPTGVPATVTVNGGGGGGAPIVKAKWEQSPGVTSGKANETGDPTHATPGTQIAPPCVFNANVPVEFWAIVTDPEGAADISTVMVDVFHPAGLPLNGSFKYQLLLVKQTLAVGTAAYNAAKAAVLVAYNTGYNDAEIQFEFSKGTDVSVWKATGDLFYEQPCGEYRALFDAFDVANHWASQGGTALENRFTYMCVPCVDIDFNAFNYGSVNVKTDKWINGDTIFNSPVAGAPAPNPATVRNIGNCLTYVTVKNSDMGFGFNGEVPTTYSGTTAPTLAQSNWNVYFDARLGNDGTIYYFDPNVTQTLLVKPLCLSTQEELDLSIHVIKSPAMGRGGTLYIGAAEAPWEAVCAGVPSHP